MQGDIALGKGQALCRENSDVPVRFQQMAIFTEIKETRQMHLQVTFSLERELGHSPPVFFPVAVPYSLP